MVFKLYSCTKNIDESLTRRIGSEEQDLTLRVLQSNLPVNVNQFEIKIRTVRKSLEISQNNEASQDSTWQHMERLSNE